MLPNNGFLHQILEVGARHPNRETDTLETASDLVKVGYIRIFTTFRKKLRPQTDTPAYGSASGDHRMAK